MCWILNPKHIGIEASGNFFTDCKKNLNDPGLNTIWLILVKLGDIFAICIPSRNCSIKENNCIQHYVKEANLFQRQHFLVVQRKEERRKLLKSYLLYTLFSGVPHWEKCEQSPLFVSYHWSFRIGISICLYLYRDTIHTSCKNYHKFTYTIEMFYMKTNFKKFHDSLPV